MCSSSITHHRVGTQEPSSEVGQGDGYFRVYAEGFPGGSVLKNLPANAGDTGSILASERSHMLQSN